MSPEEKHQARQLARRALASGRIRAAPCEVCGTWQDVEMHHDDYSRPLDVRFLCRPHHMDVDVAAGRRRRNPPPEPEPGVWIPGALAAALEEFSSRTGSTPEEVARNAIEAYLTP